MKKILKAAIMSGMGVGAGVLGAGGFLAYEAIGRNAKFVPAMIGRTFSAGLPEEKSNYEERKNSYRRWLKDHKAETLHIVSKAGNKLAATYVPSGNDSDIFVFCCHGYRYNGDDEFEKEADYFYEKGYHFICIDQLASGRSEGKYIGFGYLEAEDGLQWLAYLIDRFGSHIQIILNGISMGSATVLMMSGNSKLPTNVKFTIADCGYTSAWEEAKHVFRKLFKTNGLLVLQSMDFYIQKAASYSLKQANPIEQVKHAMVPILFVHGSQDTFVPTTMGQELFENCTSEKALVIVEGAAHGTSFTTAPELYRKHIEAFAEKYIYKVV